MLRGDRGIEIARAALKCRLLASRKLGNDEVDVALLFFCRLPRDEDRALVGAAQHARAAGFGIGAGQEADASRAHEARAGSDITLAISRSNESASIRRASTRELSTRTASYARAHAPSTIINA